MWCHWPDGASQVYQDRPWHPPVTAQLVPGQEAMGVAEMGSLGCLCSARGPPQMQRRCAPGFHGGRRGGLAVGWAGRMRTGEALGSRVWRRRMVARRRGRGRHGAPMQQSRRIVGNYGWGKTRKSGYVCGGERAWAVDCGCGHAGTVPVRRWSFG